MRGPKYLEIIYSDPKSAESVHDYTNGWMSRALPQVNTNTDTTSASLRRAIEKWCSVEILNNRISCSKAHGLPPGAMTNGCAATTVTQEAADRFVHEVSREQKGSAGSPVPQQTYTKHSGVESRTEHSRR
ncbi:hypothetical protein CBL_05709 [Carabus blaptoides fortunei]